MTHTSIPPGQHLVAQSGRNCQALRWNAAAGRLAWVDSCEGHVLTVAADGALLRQPMVDSAYTLAACSSGQWLVGLSKRLCLVDLQQWGRVRVPKLRVLAAIDVFDPRTVISDGRTDRSGNFVFGTRNIAQDQRAIGSFYQYSSAHGLRRLALPTVVDAGSICFSVDGQRMLFADGSAGTLYECEYDADSGTVGGVRPLIECEAGVRLRDAIVDLDNGVWLAQQLPGGAGRIVRYEPGGAAGSAFELVEGAAVGLAAGGPKLDQLYALDSGGRVSILPLAGRGSPDIPYADMPSTDIGAAAS